MAVLLHFALGDFEPLLPILGDHVGHKILLNLVQGCAPAIAVQDQLDDAQVIAGCHLPESVEVTGLLSEDVVCGDRLQGVRGEAKIHLVARTARKIDAELAEDSINGGDPSKAPTLVRAIAALGERQQRLDVFAADFSRDCQLFQFFSHSFK